MVGCCECTARSELIQQSFLLQSPVWFFRTGLLLLADFGCRKSIRRGEGRRIIEYDTDDRDAGSMPQLQHL